MQAGKLDQRITIQHKTVTGQNSVGADTVSWTTNTSGPYWAEIRPLRGREEQINEQRWAETWWTIRMRFPRDITVKREDRILWGTRILDIKDAEDTHAEGRARELKLTCKEFVQ